MNQNKTNLLQDLITAYKKNNLSNEEKDKLLKKIKEIDPNIDEEKIIANIISELK